VTGIIDNSKDDERKRWTELLHAGWMYHQQKVKDNSSPIIGAEITDDQLFHMSVSVAIQDAIALIQQMEAYGYFDETNEEGIEDLSKPGPAG
tara:strand:+ start:137 stop:412 length:276 start_codon:yes stop_codon:yes gene_type:complete